MKCANTTPKAVSAWIERCKPGQTLLLEVAIGYKPQRVKADFYTKYSVYKRSKGSKVKSFETRSMVGVSAASEGVREELCSAMMLPFICVTCLSVEEPAK